MADTSQASNLPNSPEQNVPVQNPPLTTQSVPTPTPPGKRPGWVTCLIIFLVILAVFFVSLLIGVFYIWRIIHTNLAAWKKGTKEQPAILEVLKNLEMFKNIGALKELEKLKYMPTLAPTVMPKIMENLSGLTELNGITAFQAITKAETIAKQWQADTFLNQIWYEMPDIQAEKDWEGWSKPEIWKSREQQMLQAGRAASWLVGYTSLKEGKILRIRVSAKMPGFSGLAQKYDEKYVKEENDKMPLVLEVDSDKVMQAVFKNPEFKVWQAKQEKVETVSLWASPLLRSEWVWRIELGGNEKAKCFVDLNAKGEVVKIRAE